MWCKVSHFVKIHMLRLRASDLGIGEGIVYAITRKKIIFKSISFLGYTLIKVRPRTLLKASTAAH